MVKTKYKEIGESLFRDILSLLTDGKHIALLGPIAGGKTLILEELKQFSNQLREPDKPHIIVMEAREFHKKTQDDITIAIAKMLGLTWDPQEYLQETLSGRLVAMIADWVKHSNRPLWIFVSNILGFAAPVARELLYTFYECHVNPTIGNRMGVVVSGSSDFIPLTYEQRSPYRYAHKLIVTGLSQEYTKKVFCVLRKHQRSENSNIKSITESDSDSEITPEALNLLYKSTGGQLHLIQQIAKAYSNITYEDVCRKVVLLKTWNKQLIEDCIKQLTHIHMHHDFYCRMAVRDFEREPDSFDLLLGILKDGDGKVTIPYKNPHQLEVSGLIRRTEENKGMISCSIWREFLDEYLSDRHIADIYVWQRRWSEAWRSFEKLPEHQRHRPISGDAAFRLKSALHDWEDSLLDFMEQGPKSVWEQFHKGIRNLLGFDEWGLFEKRNEKLIPLYPQSTFFERDISLPKNGQKPIFKQIQYQIEDVHDQEIGSGSYWLDSERMRLFCDPGIELKIFGDVRPLLFLGRKGFGNEIDSVILSYIKHSINRFWNAFITASDIEYRKGIGELREKHLKVIEHVNELLLKEPFNMGKVVQGVVDEIIEVGYYRVQICLVDSKREYIQAVASACKDPVFDINFGTNYPLEDSTKPEKKWDAQPWVVKKMKPAVILDASNPEQINPTTQYIECERISMKAIVIVPMIAEKEVIGTIHFERMDKRLPSDGEVALYEVFASQLAVALHQAQKITLLQQSIIALPDKIRIVSPDRRLIFTNQGQQIGWLSVKTPCECERKGKSPEEHCLINEIEGKMDPVHHYSIGSKGDGKTEATDWLMAKIDDFRSQLNHPFNGANPRIGYVERVHDLSELYGLYETLQKWFSEKGINNTARRILQFFKETGFEWSMIYLVKKTSDQAFLQSLCHFGLTNTSYIKLFEQGEIKFFKEDTDPQPWHVIDVSKELAIYEYRDFEVKYCVKDAPSIMGLPQYYTNTNKQHLAFGKEIITRWVEAPLFVGNEPVGKISFSMLPELSPEKWELLRSAVLGTAVALSNANWAEQEKGVIRMSWKKAAASFSHLIGNTLPAAQNRIFEITELTTTQNQPLEEMKLVSIKEDAVVALESIKHILNVAKSYREYVNKRPIKQIKHKILPFTTECLDFCRNQTRIDAPLKVDKRSVENIWIYADIDAFKDVFLSLFMDSIKFHPQNKPQIKIELKIDIYNTTKVIFIYQDSGPGIKPEYKKKIFELFFTTREWEKMGIGLTDVKEIIESHNGTIIENGKYDEFGSGVNFEITIPCELQKQEI